MRKLVTPCDWEITGEYNLTSPPSPLSAQGREFKKKREKEKKEKREKKRKEGKKKVKKKREREEKTLLKQKKRNYITHPESREGNSNDISFLLFLKSDNITFPSCLGGREVNMIP